MHADLHATLLRVADRGVLLRGPAGSGKSLQALQLLEAGAALVADDLVQLTAGAEGLSGAAPPGWDGRLALRGAGIVDVQQAFGGAAAWPRPQRLDWVVDLTAEAPATLPEHDQVTLLDATLPRLRLAPRQDHGALIRLCCRVGSAALLTWREAR